MECRNLIVFSIIYSYPFIFWMAQDFLLQHKKGDGESTWMCHHNPSVGALGIQEPVILGEPQIKG